MQLEEYERLVGEADRLSRPQFDVMHSQFVSREVRASRARFGLRFAGHFVEIAVDRDRHPADAWVSCVVCSQGRFPPSRKVLWSGLVGPGRTRHSLAGVMIDARAALADDFATGRQRRDRGHCSPL